MQWRNSVVEQGDCVLFATADWDTPYWTNKQHVAIHLAKRGWRVLYVESVGLRTPSLSSGMDLSRLLKRLWRGLRGARKVDENIWVLSPLVLPFAHNQPLVKRLNQWLLGMSVRLATRQAGLKKPLIWTYHPYMLDVITGIEHGAIVYHCVDDLAAIPGIDAAGFNMQERRLLLVADVVFTTSRALEEKCASINANVHFLPNVADYELFSRATEALPIPADLVRIPEPRIVYMGVLSDFKVDFKLLLYVATAHPEWQLVLIGDEREGQASSSVAELKELQNVHFLGFRPYRVLPDYLRGMNVGLLPSLVNDYTRFMFPMKYFEYLAAGLPVVSTPLEFTKERLGGMLVADTEGQFCTAIGEQIAGGRIPPSLVKYFVGDNTWEGRLEKMLNVLNFNAEKVHE
jgi:glycosyltransferase involved in cell wall biosynthesis